MQIPLTEPSNFRYIHINPATNRVHLLVPFIAGLDVSTDNTCKSDLELQVFFEGGAFSELEFYKNTLELHLSLLEESGTHYHVKKERLTQINKYLETIVDMRTDYKNVVNTVLGNPSNLYSIQLRPRIQDPMSRVVNPIFTINRSNDSRGTPLSPLYNKMHEVFPGVTLGKSDPREQIITTVLSSLSPNASFENIQDVLATQYGVPDDFFKKIFDEHRQEQVVDRTYVDRLMGFDEHTTSREYIEALLGLCAPNLQNTLQGSSFYFESSASLSEKAERLSILTQFYLGSLNVYCRAKGISDKNFGMILDDSPFLSHQLVEVVAGALSRGEEVASAIVSLFNHHQNEFKLSRKLTSDDNDVIIQKFETTYRTVTATKENPHMDDFMFLDTEAHGEHDIFITNKGLICTDASNVIPTTLQHQDYFAEIRHEARMHRDIFTSQDEPVIMIDITPEALMNKLNDIQWEMLPKAVIDACRVLPAFKVRELLNDVAKGKQDEANTVLESAEDIQVLLRTPGKLTDYSGRTFCCTAYEYAYWAKDTHMQRMLERHMDDETKAFLLGQIDMIEHSGLVYQQHEMSYQNAHYDMSFVLNNLNVDEFHQLKTMVGQRSAKIQQATVDNYQNISFTVTEYEALKKILEQHRSTNISSFFYISPAKALSDKLQFDFLSLIAALDAYVTNYNTWSYHQQIEGLMRIGKAQRDVPAHIAHEYCRPDRLWLFNPSHSFNEGILPRILTFDNYVTNDRCWFPLSSASSGLGFDFALIRAIAGESDLRQRWWAAFATASEGQDMTAELGHDLAAVRHLDEVRVANLTQSRENLSRPASHMGLVYTCH